MQRNKDIGRFVKPSNKKAPGCFPEAFNSKKSPGRTENVHPGLKIMVLAYAAGWTLLKLKKKRRS